MKKYLRIFFFCAVLALIVGPVIVTQMTEPGRREFQATKLEDTTYTEIGFRNDEQRLELGGMLFVPDGEGPFPAVVIIHGSGSSRRGNGWYLTLTEYLQANGVAVLLPDKRGSEKSHGNWRNASFHDLATDTVAAVRYLKNQDRVALSHVGLVGMSQGGWIAPIAAAGTPDVAFIVSVVGSAVRPNEQLLYEEDHNLRQMGFLPGISKLVAYASTAYIRNVAQKEFWDANGDFDPLPYWQTLAVNALALYGADDTNVPSARSAENLRALGKPNIEVRIYEGSGHALEDPEGLGRSIFRADALRDIVRFILAEAARP